MATFKICVRKQRNDGIYPVYIRVAQDTTVAYIRTDKVVTSKFVSKKEVTNPYVIRFLSQRIVDYTERLNQIPDTSKWKANDIVNYLKNGEEELCFSDYARRHADKMCDKGMARNARNYIWALEHMERFAGTTKIKFSMLTSGFLSNCSQAHRSCPLYLTPILFLGVFNLNKNNNQRHNTASQNIHFMNKNNKEVAPQSENSNMYKIIGFRVTPEELARIDEHANECGLNRSEYLSVWWPSVTKPADV